MEPKRAPKGRINITYNLDNEPQEISELPLRYMVVGDFTHTDDSSRIEDRKIQTVHRSNFDNVMKALKPSLSIDVEDTLSGAPGRRETVQIEFEKMVDFEPDALVEKMRDKLAALDKALKLRDALVAVRGSMTTPSFRRKLQTLIDDEEQRQRLMTELGMEP